MRHLFDAVPHAADALELCWKIRAGIAETIGEKPNRVSFPRAATCVGLAFKPYFWSEYEFRAAFLKTGHEARNSRHGSFDDGVPIEHVADVFALVFVEIQRATGEGLERHVSPAAWQRLRAVSQFTRAIELALSQQLPLRAGHLYLRCQICGIHAFDSSADRCRWCLHGATTFVCPGCSRRQYSILKGTDGHCLECVGRWPLCELCAQPTHPKRLTVCDGDPCCDSCLELLDYDEDDDGQESDEDEFESDFEDRCSQDEEDLYDSEDDSFEYTCGEYDPDQDRHFQDTAYGGLVDDIERFVVNGRISNRLVSISNADLSHRRLYSFSGSALR